jgi:hypothetical protein
MADPGELGVGVRSICWDCGTEWDGWSSQNPEGTPCYRCEGTNTHHKPEIMALRAEVERLRKVENDALWLARLACGSSWPMEMAQGVEDAAARVRAAFSASRERET